MKPYVTQFILSAVAILGVIGVVNWAVDPYWILGSPEIKHFNAIKPSIHGNRRIFQTTHVLRNHPQALIIGTSRENNGIDPKHPAFLKHSVFNAAINGQPLVESKELLRVLSEKGNPPSLIVFGLLFEAANVYSRLPDDFSMDNLSDSRPYQLLLNFSTTKASAITVAANVMGKETSDLRKDGFRPPSAWVNILRTGHRRAFQNSEGDYLPRACKIALVAEDGNAKRLSTMEEFREAVAIAYRTKADMRLFIGPSHARQWEIVGINGLWGQFEEWKRMLLGIVNAEAEKAHAAPFPLWDFSGYNSITEENVPPIQDVQTRMLNYYESSHYTPATGDLVLDRIFGLKTSERPVPEDFGVFLTSRNIESHLAGIRSARKRYQQTHPEEITELEARARDSIRQKHCTWVPPLSTSAAR